MAVNVSMQPMHWADQSGLGVTVPHPEGRPAGHSVEIVGWGVGVLNNGSYVAVEVAGSCARTRLVPAEPLITKSSENNSRSKEQEKKRRLCDIWIHHSQTD